MASFFTMLPLRKAPEFSREQLRQHFNHLAKQRGVAPWFDRFASHRLTQRALALHIDFIEVHPEAPTVVFMPGTNAYAMLYGEFLTALVDRGYNVVGFDPRGHGRSDGRRGSYTLPELVDDFEAVALWAKQRFSGPLFIAGSSQGGIAAFYYASRQNVPIDGVICHNLADLADPQSARLTRFPALSRALSATIQSTARKVPELPVPMSAYLDLASEPVSGLGSARDVLHNDPLTVPFVRLRTLASLAHEPLPRPPEQFQVPILVLQAEQDSIFPTDYIQTLFARIAGPRTLKVYPGLPHYMIVDCVPEFIEDVSTWIDAIAGASLTLEAAS